MWLPEALLGARSLRSESGMSKDLWILLSFRNVNSRGDVVLLQPQCPLHPVGSMYSLVEDSGYKSHNAEHGRSSMWNHQSESSNMDPMDP